MIALLNEVHVASGLAMYIRGWLKRSGLDDVELARRAGIDKGGLSYILNTPNAEPTLRTLKKLATGMGEPLGKLITLMGYELGDEDGNLDTERIAILLEEVPELQEMIDDVALLSPDEMRSALAYIRGRRDQL